MTGVFVPVIETERLILRGPRLDDRTVLADFMASDRSGFVGGPMPVEETWRMLLRIAGHWQIRGYGLWFADDRETGELAGWAGLIHQIETPEPELAWSVFPGFEGRSIAFEATLAARSHVGRHFGISAPMSQIDPANHRSRRLAERLGAWFERDAEMLGKPMQIWRHPKTAKEAA